MTEYEELITETRRILRRVVGYLADALEAAEHERDEAVQRAERAEAAITEHLPICMAQHGARLREAALLARMDEAVADIHEAAGHIDRITSESDADALSYDGIGDGIEEPWCWGENSYEHYQNQCQHNYAGSVTHDREAESEAAG